MKYNLKTLSPVFDLLEKCDGIEQDAKYHPERDVLEHSIQTFNWARRESFDLDLIIAALCHDIGKSFDKRTHATVGGILLAPHVSTKSLWLVKNHMRFWNYIEGKMRKITKVRAFHGHPWFPDLVQLARFDKAGRDPDIVSVFDRQDIVDKLNRRVKQRSKYLERQKPPITEVIAGKAGREGKVRVWKSDQL